MLETIRNVDYVVLLCDDLAAMRAFYEGVMRFPVYRELDGWIELRTGATLLTLRRRDRPYEPPPAVWVGLRPTGVSGDSGRGRWLP